MAHLLHELITDAAWRTPAGLALRYGDNSLNYSQLAQCVEASAQALLALDLQRGDRVAVFLEKREEAVLAMFGAAAAGCAFVPINPLLKPEQVAHILRDSGARILVTSPARRAVLDPVLARCPDLRCVLQTGEALPQRGALPVLGWDACLRDAAPRDAHRIIDSDLAALIYSSGSSGRPRGVVLTHRNLLAGADSLVRCLGMQGQDRILAALPLSREDGFSQLSSAFASGAALVLMNPLLTRDIPDMVALERITGLTAVAPLWIQLSALEWQQRHALRYLASAGAPLPRDTLLSLQRRLPHTKIFVMTGLSDAFRSCVLGPDELLTRPGSIGKAMPNAELLVLDGDGRPCGPGEPGELVQRGALVAPGFWNDPSASSETFRALPGTPGMPLSETGMWSGETVRADADGYLYPLGRADELIKTSGYRVSPGEIEEVVYTSGLVAEVAAVGIAHPVHGQAIALVATPAPGCVLDSTALLAPCRAQLPRYMLPCLVDMRAEPLPRDAGGRIDRRRLARELGQLFAQALV
ncbi:MAG: acyl-CoA ligase (AMP-forming), exosortase A system-associated [Pseudomonadota bacterium]